jgi:hypothetical protein
MPQSREPSAWHARGATGHSSAAAQIENLERLRDWVLERLDSLEKLARQRSASAPSAGEIADLQRALEQKTAELKATEQRLRAQADHQEQERSASLAQLEADRRLLANAREGIERERIEVLGAAKRDSRLLPQAWAPQRRGPAALQPLGTATRTRSTATDSRAIDPIAQEILRQFQALCRDVRRGAESRYESG